MNNENNVLIIGKGVVGTNLGNELSALKPDFVDKFKPNLTTKDDSKKYKLGFICVDTPIIENHNLDIEQVKNAILENECEIYVIKSTCPIGTVEKLTKELNKNIIFSPEYYGGTPNCNNYVFDFTILGGDKGLCRQVIQVIMKCYDGRHIFKIVDSKIAELTKFMENSFLATKVTFCTQFHDFCKKNNMSYEELRECFILDPRVGQSHTFVFDTQPYWNSHCLNKDVPHLAYVNEFPLLQKVCEINENSKK